MFCGIKISFGNWEPLCGSQLLSFGGCVGIAYWLPSPFFGEGLPQQPLEQPDPPDGQAVKDKGGDFCPIGQKYYPLDSLDRLVVLMGRRSRPLSAIADHE